MTGKVEDKLTEAIIHCILTVHHALGPGFLESVYRKALLLELKAAGLGVKTAKEFVVTYRQQEVGRHRLDLLVEGKVIIELKTVEELSLAHYAQVRSYLKATGLQTALLVNHSKPLVDFRRVTA